MTVQEQLADAVGRAHTSWADAVVKGAEKVEDALSIPRKVVVPFEPVDAVDKAFDLAQRGLDLNRQVAKALVSTASSFVEAGPRVAESVGQATRHSAEVAANALREEAEILERETHEAAEAAERETLEQARAARREAREEAKDRYADASKTDLQDELEKRGIAKTGTVDELRQRLVDADVSGAN